MTTRVVNLRREPYDVYIGRAGKGQDGYFGNPVRGGPMSPQCTYCGRWHETPGDTLACFNVYFVDRISHDPEFKRRVLELRGKTLGCFCKPKVCHGDVIARYCDTGVL